MDRRYLDDIKKDEELGFYKYCLTCESDDIDCYQRCSSCGGVVEIIYSYLECNECRTPSHNTTTTFTIEDVIKDWNKKVEEGENPCGVWRKEWERPSVS